MFHSYISTNIYMTTAPAFLFRQEIQSQLMRQYSTTLMPWSLQL